MFKKIIVLYIYILIFLNFSKADSFNISNLSNMLFQNTAQGINNDFTYYTLSKQNNLTSPTYIDGSLYDSKIDNNQKYQIRISNFHYTVIRTNDNFIIDGNGTLGTVAQKSGTNICELLATDNSLYLNNFDNLYYSDFSRNLQSMRYNDDLVLFYTMVEIYSRKTSFFQNNSYFFRDYRNESFNEIFRNLLNDGNLMLEPINEIIQEFSNMINYHAQTIFGNEKNINNISPDEFKQIMFKIFTQIKNRMKLDGEFDPLTDTPHLLRIFDYSETEITENNRMFIKKYNTFIVNNLLKQIDNFYLYFNKNIIDYHNFINDSNDGFNYSLSYNKEQNNEIFNIFTTYQKSFNNFLSSGIGLNFAKYNVNNLDINFNGVLFFKIKNNITSSNIGFYYGKLIPSPNYTENSMNYKFSDNFYGYFIRLYKDINVNTSILRKIRISSSYFNNIYKIKNIKSKNLIYNKMNIYNNVNISSHYFYNIIGFYLPNFNIFDSGLIETSFGAKNITYLSNNHINKNNRCINNIFIKNNVKIKNHNLYIDLGTDIKNITNSNLHVLYVVNF